MKKIILTIIFWLYLSVGIFLTAKAQLLLPPAWDCDNTNIQSYTSFSDCTGTCSVSECCTNSIFSAAQSECSQNHDCTKDEECRLPGFQISSDGKTCKDLGNNNLESDICVEQGLSEEAVCARIISRYEWLKWLAWFEECDNLACCDSDDWFCNLITPVSSECKDTAIKDGRQTECDRNRALDEERKNLKPQYTKCKDWWTTTTDSIAGIICNPELMELWQCKFNVYDTLWIRKSDKDTSVWVFVQDIILSATMFIWTIVVIAMVISGLMFVFAGANSGLKEKAMKGLVNAFIGLLLVLSSYTIIRLIQFIIKGD